MKKIKIYTLVAVMFTLLGSASCKKDLDVKNPNQPTLDQASNEPGIIALSLGSVYTSGFNGVDLSTLNPLGDSFFMLALSYHELLADNISSQNANQNYNIINLPDYLIDDNGLKTINQSPHKKNVRINNTRDKRGTNAFYYEWAYMYALNNGMNAVLKTANSVKFSGDAVSRLKTIQAWAYWWKGFAYARLGSIYYAGLITDVPGGTNNMYVSHTALIAESNRCFNLAITTLASVTSIPDYTTVLTKLIPAFLQTGNGGVLTPAQWTHNINTMLARNILVNAKTTSLSSTDWASISSLTAAGIQAGDPVFIGKTSAANPFFSLTGGATVLTTVGDNSASNFKISERLIQEYKAGDNRMSENFARQQYLNSVGGLLSSTRYQLVSAGNSIPAPVGTNLPSYILGDYKTPGNYQLFIAGSYEENELMKAESAIYTGQTDAGLTSVDNVRKYQGAGLPAVSGTGLTMAQALEELRRERRVALIFRGTAFYDARRWGVIYDITQGGGRTGAVVLSSTGVLSMNATINYNFLDYWDVPADESAINTPGTGSAAIVNPN